MCGIAGIISVSPNPAHVDRVTGIVDYQFHRGPDHQAVQVVRREAPTIVFGHDRLSILDLSTAANQPFWSSDRRYCVTFNGEIYNYREIRDQLCAIGHRFRTTSDTEVLVEAIAEWGVDAICRLNGMFAFAIADTQAAKVWLVRDRFGVKPLFFACPNPSEIRFASTAESISRELKLSPQYEYLSDGIRLLVYEDGSERTQFQGLKSVSPGCYLEIVASDDGISCSTKRYYNLGERVRLRQTELEGKTEVDLIEICEAQLRAAVRLRLRADVPLGVSLSGGLDSSLVTCLAAQEGGNVVGVSFGHPKHPKTEGPAVAVIAKHLGLKVHYVWPSGGAMTEALWEALKAQEAPFPGLSIVAQYLVFKEARAIGLKVMLGGQGADEAFMGYRKYLYMTLRKRDRSQGVVGDLFGLAKLIGLEFPRMIQNLADVERYAGRIKPFLNLPVTQRDLGLSRFSQARGRQLKDVTEFSLPTLLRYEDRNSMGNSVESRLPFMDYQVIETGLALPDRLKVRGGYCKWILRRIADRLLPKSITKNRIKVGFDALTAEWVQGGLGEDVRLRLRQAIGSSGYQGISLPEQHFGDEVLGRKESAMCQALTAIWLVQRGYSPQELFSGSSIPKPIKRQPPQEKVANTAG